MSKLKAFVGHSFSNEDASVIRTILDYLKQIQEMNIEFSWEHAQPAEPRELAEKVKKLMEDKNLLIGICTKKERVIEDEKLINKLFYPGHKCAKDKDFSWKTSDWIIQEIGLAIGREMDLILIVEDDVRIPGGLQGDLEYIPFSRQSPEKSFVKILEMIKALLPKAKLVEASISEKTKIAEEKPEEKGADWLTPQSEWDRDDYDMALFHMVLSKNKEGEENIHNAYLAIDEGKEEKNIKSWFATKEYYHIWLANDGSLEKLKSMVKESPENSDVQRYLAKGYQVYGEDVKAAVSYKQAADKEENDSKKLQILGEAASAYAKTNKKADLEELIANIKKLAQSVDEGKILLLGILKDIASEQEDKLSYVAYAERLLDLKPDDNDTRFNLAYAHSKEKHNELALYHYLKIPYKNRSAVTWNNLGVARERLNLNGKAIEAYRISEKQGETLAMDNIARMYLSVGFLEKAQQQCEQAKKEEGYKKY